MTYLGMFFKKTENILAVIIFIAMAVLPFIEIIARLFSTNFIPSSMVIVQHMTLWIGFIGAIIASRKNKLLSLTTSPIYKKDELFHPGRWLAKNISFLVVICLAYGSYNLVLIEHDYPFNIAPKIPRWSAMIIMPFGFIIMAIHMFMNSYKNYFLSLLFIITGTIVYVVSISWTLQENTYILSLGLLVLFISLIYGAPIFVGLGGAAILLFWSDYTSLSAIPAEAYRIVVNPSLPVIPLFTLAGYLLAESGTSTRLVNVFRSLFGWIPGGTPAVVVILCGFFTALTGGSGVTILALGGLLLPLLIKEGYSRKFSLGLITVSGSIGLLFPPSLPAIIYGVTAGISVKNVFVAGLMPGMLLILLISSYAFYQGKSQKINIQKFNRQKAILSCKETIWELLIPVLVLFGVFSGYTTIVETAAMVVLYVLTIELFVYKDLNIAKLPRIIVDCSTLIGGVIIILGVAMGLTSYLVDAQVPMHLLEWAQDTISSKYLFLFLLNLFLLAAGCLMDVFSAIIVIVPLIKPLGNHFGIEPFHMAIIFIANLELGFLTPPVGMNLFLAAYRFDVDMPKIYRATLPFFIVKLLAVALITYFPIITLGLLD